MLDMFTKRWYVPAHSKNEKQVPKTLQKFGISYDRFLVIDETTKETVGYVFRFNCVPLAYTGIKMACQGGNGFVPLEITLSK